MTTLSATSMIPPVNIESICRKICNLSKQVTEDESFPSVFQKNQSTFRILTYQLFDAISKESEKLLSNAYFLLSYIELMSQAITYKHTEIAANNIKLEFEFHPQLKQMVSNVAAIANRILQLNAKKTVANMELEVRPEIQEKLLAWELASTLGTLKRLGDKATRPSSERPPLFLIKLDGPSPLERLQKEIEETIRIVLAEPTLSTDPVINILERIKDLLNCEPGLLPHTILKSWRETNLQFEKYVSDFAFPTQKKQVTTTPSTGQATPTQPATPLDATLVLSSTAKTSTGKPNTSKPHLRKPSEEYDTPEGLLGSNKSSTTSPLSKESINVVFDMGNLDFQLLTDVLPTTTPQPFYKELCDDAIKEGKFERLEMFFLYPHFLKFNLAELIHMNEKIPNTPQTEAIKTKIINRIQQLLPSSDSPSFKDSDSSSEEPEEKKNHQSKSRDGWLVVPKQNNTKNHPKSEPD